MYLSELEIYGFKSFGQKTKFKFNGGITALVGPNGCGKTNIVDAIRWVLGEQKSSVLRSDVMENVIFNGTATRKPLGLSEVTMLIENDKGILSSEYNQVNITRRLFRSGDSNYFLNKTKCRLKDVHNLFMDTGMGADSYSVIELKMVEAILSGKPEERRHLFEEAAGITKYKLRRKETTNKLVKVKEDLDRVNDILIEIQKNVNSLSKQATKTKKYNLLLNELKESELKLFYFEYLLINEKLISIEDEINRYNNELDELNEKFENINNSKNIKREELNLIQAEYQKYLNEEKEINLIYNEKKQSLAVCNERINTTISQKNRLEYEINNSNEEIQKIKESIFNSTKDLNLKLEFIKDIEENKDILYKKRSELAEKLKVQKEEYDSKNNHLLGFRNDLNINKNNLNLNKNKLISIQNKINEFETELSNIDSNIINFKEKEIQINEEIDIITKENYELNNRLIKEKEKKELIDKELQKFNQEIINQKSNLSSKKASLDFLKSLSDTDSTISYLMKSNEVITNYEKQTIIEAINIDVQYQTALLSVLGEKIHYFIMNNIEEVNNAIDLLKNNEKGFTNFIVKKNIEKINNEEIISNNETTNILNKFNDIFYLKDKVKTDKELIPLVNYLLKDVIYLKDNSDAIEFINELNSNNISHISVITNDGTYYKSDFLIKGGKSNSQENALIGRNLKIREVERDILEINSIITDYNTKIINLTSELKEININELQHDIHNNEIKINRLNQDYSKNELNIHSIENKQNNIIENKLKLEKEIDDVNLIIDELNNKVIENETFLNVETEKFIVHKNNLENLEIEFKTIDNNYREIEISFTKTNSEINLVKQIISQFESQLTNFDNRLINNKNELKEIEINISSLNNNINIFNEELIDVETKLLVIKNEKTFKENLIQDFRLEVEENEKALENLRKNIDKRKENIHKLDLNLNELLTNKNVIDNKLFETYNLEINSLNYENEAFNLIENKNNVIELKIKLSEIGSVNFLALEEYEEQNNRLIFTQNQINDLLEAEKTLIETINEINQKAEQNFSETFEKVRENFKYLFTKLFNEEGFADLKLSEGNLLESDIEITAKPPGKKPHSIEMLSGGEKTLTAIALLFAIYMVKPSPFCILDEVDAPLDDANIGRFINMIRQFTDKTQFLIVTHNKKTMEAADTLYGITQQETGLSTIVSVRFGEESIEKLNQN